MARRGLTLASLIMAANLLDSGTALAWKWHTTDARSRSSEVTFSIGEVRGDNGSIEAVSGGVSCSYELSLGNIGIHSGYWKEAPSDTAVLALKSCSDGTDEFVWVDLAPRSPPPRVDPVVLARRVRDRLPVPAFEIAANPRRGLVGTKTWFWLEGGGRPVSDSLTAFGVTVEVEARPVNYRWDFGDGITLTTPSPGAPYPKRSPVTHVYERSSAEHQSGYVMSVETVFDVRWRTNGGRWRELPPVARVSDRYYSVAESQAVNSRD